MTRPMRRLPHLSGRGVFFPERLSTGQAARRYGIAHSTLRTWARKDLIRGTVKCDGGHFSLRRDYLERFLARPKRTKTGHRNTHGETS
ncbi:MAG: helix-turn-helix domain-containing protein [Paracoccaceae bacterium]